MMVSLKFCAVFILFSFITLYHMESYIIKAIFMKYFLLLIQPINVTTKPPRTVKINSLLLVS